MFGYENFKKRVLEAVGDYLVSTPYELRNAEIRAIEKNNGTTWDALVCTVTERAGGTAVITVPNVYLQPFYEDYSAHYDFDSVMCAIRDDFCSGVQRVSSNTERNSLMNLFSVDNIMTNCFVKVVNYESNQEYLKDKPHRRMLDLAVVPCVRVEAFCEGGGIASFAVDNNLLDKLGINRDVFLATAEKNTREFFEPAVLPMGSVIVDSMVSQGMPREEAECFLDEMPESPLIVLTNNIKTNGAAALLCEDILHEVAQQKGENLFVLPSSVHEVLLCPADNMGISAEELSEMVREINGSLVSKEELLSNNVYFYDKNKRELSMASDAPELCRDNTKAVPEAVKSR